MNYVDDYECSAGCYVPDATGMPVRATSPVRISDWKTFDFNIGYDLSGLGGFFNDARVNFTAVNFTDADPPFFDSGTTARSAARRVGTGLVSRGRIRGSP